MRCAVANAILPLQDHGLSHARTHGTGFRRAGFLPGYNVSFKFVLKKALGFELVVIYSTSPKSFALCHCAGFLETDFVIYAPTNVLANTAVARQRNTITSRANKI